MFIIQEPRTSDSSQCPYLAGRELRFRYFFGYSLSADELDSLLRGGWRKFGMYYFKPVCMECMECIPIRIPVSEFIPSKSQRRVLKKGSSVSVEFNGLQYRDEIFDIYRDHSAVRFGKASDRGDFISSFYTESCPSIQSEYFIDGTLFAVGFLDVSAEALSSVYFVFKRGFEHLSPGVLSVLMEVDYARSIGLKYYYLGYYVEKNRSMAYKNRYFPNEKYDWTGGVWVRDRGEKEID